MYIVIMFALCQAFAILRNISFLGFCVKSLSTKINGQILGHVHQCLSLFLTYFMHSFYKATNQSALLKFLCLVTQGDYVSVNDQKAPIICVVRDKAKKERDRH